MPPPSPPSPLANFHFLLILPFVCPPLLPALPPPPAVYICSPLPKFMCPPCPPPPAGHAELHGRDAAPLYLVQVGQVRRQGGAGGRGRRGQGGKTAASLSCCPGSSALSHAAQLLVIHITYQSLVMQPSYYPYYTAQPLVMQLSP